LRSHLLTKFVDRALILKSDLEVPHSTLNEWALLLDGVRRCRPQLWLNRNYVSLLSNMNGRAICRHKLGWILREVRRAAEGKPDLANVATDNVTYLSPE
jgi:hypothetical protein